MSDVLTTTAAGVDNDLQTYFDKTLLKNAQYQTKLDQFGRKTKIPAHSGKEVQWVGYSDLTVNTNTLTEGTAPDAVELVSTKVNATVDQIGDLLKLTDLAALTPAHDAVQAGLKRLSTLAARKYDRIVNSVVVAGTGVIYAGTGNAARTDIGAGDIAKMDNFATAIKTLRNNGALEFADGTFVAVIDPTVEYQLMKDSDFRDAAIRNGLGVKGEVYKGEIATFNGIRFVRSNNIPTVSSTVTVHTAYVFGQDSYGITDLQNIRTYRETGGVSDPLHQIMTLGYKAAFKSAILNNNFMQRVECADV